MKVALDLLHEGRNAGSVGYLLAARLWGDHLVDRSKGRTRADIAERVTPAGHAAVGGDLEHDDVERRNRRGALPEAGDAGVIGNADVMCADVADLHGSAPPGCYCFSDDAWFRRARARTVKRAANATGMMRT